MLTCVPIRLSWLTFQKATKDPEPDTRWLESPTKASVLALIAALPLSCMAGAVLAPDLVTPAT